MKRLFLVFSALALIALSGGCVHASIVKAKYQRSPSLPPLDGQLEVAGLAGPVDVYRDAYGVPHIFTENEHDLFFATGYVQAQDRLWEMILFRAVAEGRMSELFGDLGMPGGGEMMGMPLSTVGLDLRQRTMGLKWLGEVGAALLERGVQVSPQDRQVLEQLQAFCAGANAFIASHQNWSELPIEFQVLKVKPEPFTVADVISLNMLIGSMLAGNLDEELLRYGLFKKYGADLGWSLLPLHVAPGPTIVPNEMLHNRLARPRDLPPGGRPADSELGYDFDSLSGDDALDLMRAETGIKKVIYPDYPFCSNNWIVGPKLTESHAAMLANDPHLSHVQPSMVYMMHVKGAGWDVFGATFPGMPYIVLGHNRKLAWAETTSIADVQDLFIETVDPDRPGEYLHQGEWRPFTVRPEIVKVRVGGRLVEREFKVRQTIHGPVINDLGAGKDAPPLALRWTAWDFTRDLSLFEKIVTSATLDELMAKLDDDYLKGMEMMSGAHAFNLIGKGDSIDDFIAGMGKLTVPNQNWVAADDAGHIVYLPGGLVPIRKKGIGVLPVPGAEGAFDWSGFIPLMELPHAIDPERGYMVSANNEVVDAEWYPYLFGTGYGDGFRAWRIEELIDELAPLDMKDMRRIQNDVRVKRADWEMPFIRAAVENKKPTDPMAIKAFAELDAWDHEADIDNTAGVIFFTFLRQLRRNTLEDEMPKKDYQAFLARGDLDQAVNLWLTQGGSDFFDDKRTQKLEDMDDIIVKSLADAMREVVRKEGRNPERRQWGKLHYIKWYHPLGWGVLSELSVGPYPHIGANNTVRNASPAGMGRDPWKALGGPVLRHLIDLSDPDRALIIIDGSQSGQWLSPHYKDLHALFVDSEYLYAEMRPEQVRATAPDHLVLTP